MKPPPDDDLTVAQDLGGHATSLLDLSDSLGSAIERNYRESQKYRRDVSEGRVGDPRRAMASHAGLTSLLELALKHTEAQGSDLELLTLSLGTRAGEAR